MPIEISKLLAYFLPADEGKNAVVTVARQVTCRCSAKIQLEKLKEKREKFHFFRIEIPQENGELHCMSFNFKYVS